MSLAACSLLFLRFCANRIGSEYNNSSNSTTRRLFLVCLLRRSSSLVLCASVGSSLGWATQEHGKYEVDGSITERSYCCIGNLRGGRRMYVIGIRIMYTTTTTELPTNLLLTINPFASSCLLALQNGATASISEAPTHIYTHT